MAESDDDSQKTEQPTEKRLRDAVEKGQVIYSREVTNFFLVLALTIIIATLIPDLFKKTVSSLNPYLESSYDLLITKDNVGKIFKDILLIIFKIIIIPTSFIMIAGLTSTFIQAGGINFSSSPLSPKLEKISLIKGAKRIFSISSVVEFIKGIVKIIVVALTAYLVVRPELNRLNQIHDYDIRFGLIFLFDLTIKMLIAICCILFFIALFDYLYQRYKYYNQLKMTKHEIKEEYKQSEGNPEIKAKLRRLRSERARQRLSTIVPKSTVILTNPTHYSVALEYDKEFSPTPKVIAKGQDFLALRIREIAKKHDIPIIENKPLARALYNSVEIGQEIPVSYYKAVAEIISYVYKLKNKF